MDTKTQAEIDSFEKPGGEHHAGWLKNDPSIRQKWDALYQRLYPEATPQTPTAPPPSSPGTTPQIGNPSDKAQGPAVHPRANTSEKSEADSPEIADAHLRQQWQHDYDRNWKQVEIGRDSVFNKADPNDEAVYHAVLGSPLANNPQFLEVLRTISKEPLASNVPDISRFSEARRRDMAGAVAMDLLRHTGIPVNENHPIIRELAAILDEKTLIDWGCRLHERLYRR
jgi:hypothetical protein